MGTPARRLLLFESADYRQKVLSYGPIAYWPQNEASGAVAYCQVNPAQNGAYTGVTLGGVGIGDGNTAPFYDGANDYTNIYTATLSGRFNGATGSIAVWMRVTNVGVWTDGVERQLLRILVDANNYLNFSKRNVNNRMDFLRNAGGVLQTKTVVGLTSTAYIHFAATWSETANQYIVYLDAVAQGATLPANAWTAGPLVATQTVLGAQTTVPTVVWNGWLAHCAIWNRALAPAEVAALATI